MTSTPAKRIERYEKMDYDSICYWKNDAGLWWIYKPGSWTAKLRNHQVVELEDGTITVTPAIVFDGRHGKPCTGFLTAGLWTDL
jgi:hypothetical protein